MKKSFTLIELLVVTVIVLIFSGISLARYNDFTQQLKLKSEAKKLIDIIELAKKKSLTSELIVTPNVTPPTFCSDFSGYRVTLNANSYSLNFCCNSSCGTSLNTYDFDPKVSIVSTTGNLDFPPRLLNIELSISPITLKNNLINQCINIWISNIGVVELDEALADC